MWSTAPPRSSPRGAGNGSSPDGSRGAPSPMRRRPSSSASACRSALSGDGPAAHRRSPVLRGRQVRADGAPGRCGPLGPGGRRTAPRHRGYAPTRRRHGRAPGSPAQRPSRSVHYEDRILPVDGRVADMWGRLNVPDPLPAVDGLLAAMATVHDVTLVTRNTSDVARAGVRLLDPFAP